LQIKDYFGKDFSSNGNDSFTESVISNKKSENASISKKLKNYLELGEDKISAMLDLNFKKDIKTVKKLPLTIPFKFQKREIGFI
jgi:hypothetical protein